MPSSTVTKNFTDGSIALKDGTGSPIMVTGRFTTGDLNLSGLKAKMRETTGYETRGVLNSVRHTVRKFATISFTAHMSEFTSASANSLVDACLKNGAFAAAVSTLGANAEVYTLDVVITEEGTNFGDSADHTVTLEDVEFEVAFAEGDPNTFSFSGTVWGAITGDLAVE